MFNTLEQIWKSDLQCTPDSTTSETASYVLMYDEESDHSNKAVRKTPEIESGHKVSEEVKWT